MRSLPQTGLLPRHMEREGLPVKKRNATRNFAVNLIFRRVRCPVCQGDKRITAGTCPFCEGRGYKKKRKL